MRMTRISANGAAEDRSGCVIAAAMLKLLGSRFHYPLCLPFFRALYSMTVKCEDAAKIALEGRFQSREAYIRRSSTKTEGNLKKERTKKCGNTID
jgi:hypothetical protein